MADMKNKGIVKIGKGYMPVPLSEKFWIMDFLPCPIYIFDLDGTLADISHRLHFISGKDFLGNLILPDWDSFFKACVDDKPIQPMIKLTNQLNPQEDYDSFWVWIVSGRSSMVAQETCKWLDDNEVKYDWLFMREKSDHRPDYEIKEEWLGNLPKAVRRNIVCVFEDRKSVVDMWRRNGVFCCQVNEGNF